MTKLLPNVLGKKLPTSLQKLGQFNFAGKVEVSSQFINSNFKIRKKGILVLNRLINLTNNYQIKT